MWLSTAHQLALAAALLPFLPAHGRAVELEPRFSEFKSAETVSDPAPKGYEEYTTPIVLPSPNVTGSDGWLAAVTKARAFVEDLTVAEMVNLTTGIGMEARCVGQTGTVPRKNFTGICLEDAPLGVRPTDFVSVFPAGLNAAATWDKELFQKRGEAMGAEFRGKGINVALGPMMNIARAPEAGRIFEGSGADPYLSGVASAQTVIGIQSQGVIACAKHFIGNDQETYRGPENVTAESSNNDDRTLHEVYAWPFAASVNAGVGSIMCSYQKVNQTYSCQNSKTLNGLLKGELDFQGFVVTDWWALHSGAKAALSGVDMDMPGYNVGPALVDSVHNGSVPLERLRDMVTRIMTAYYQMGQDVDYPAVNFDQTTEDTYSNGVLVNEHVDVQADHYKLIREIGAASTILLKNIDGALPLTVNSTRRWGIFGSDAGPRLNGPNGINDVMNQDWDDGTLAVGTGSGSAKFSYLVDPLSAIQTYIRSYKPTSMIEAVLNDTNYDQIQAVARQAGVCLAFVNANAGEGNDRTNLTLWHAGDSLIANVTSQCNNTIVVIHSSGVVLIDAWASNPNVTAILYAGLPGQESGNSIVDVLFGAVNPSGRLTQTIAKKQSDYNAHVLYNSSMSTPQITYKEKLLVDYKWFDHKNITPLYEFGYGLSYSTFSYSNISVEAATALNRRSTLEYSSKLYDTAYSVSFTITNTGSVDGHEVAQLYLGFPESVGEPPKNLRGFERTLIAGGASANVSLSLTNKDISIWDVVSQNWVIPTGIFTVMIGQSSRQIVLTATFTE